MEQKDNPERRGAERRPITTEVEFYVDADIVEASSIDLSKTGVQLSTDRPIRIRLRMDVDGKATDHQAELVWARRSADGDMSYGFEFLEDTDEVLFGPDTDL